MRRSTNDRSRHTAHCGLPSAEFDRSPRRPRRRARRWRRSATSSLSIIAMCARKSIRSRTHIVCHDHAMQTRLGNCWSTRTIGVDCVLLSFAKRNRSYHSRDSICYLSTTTRERTKSSTSRLWHCGMWSDIRWQTILIVLIRFSITLICARNKLESVTAQH